MHECWKKIANDLFTTWFHEIPNSEFQYFLVSHQIDSDGKNVTIDWGICENLKLGIGETMWWTAQKKGWKKKHER